MAEEREVMLNKKGYERLMAPRAVAARLSVALGRSIYRRGRRLNDPEDMQSGLRALAEGLILENPPRPSFRNSSS